MVASARAHPGFLANGEGVTEASRSGGGRWLSPRAAPLVSGLGRGGGGGCLHLQGGARAPVAAPCPRVLPSGSHSAWLSASLWASLALLSASWSLTHGPSDITVPPSGRFRREQRPPHAHGDRGTVPV